MNASDAIKILSERGESASPCPCTRAHSDPYSAIAKKCSSAHETSVNNLNSFETIDLLNVITTLQSDRVQV